MIDIHHHGLPGIDDGCIDLAESLTLLREEYKQGVKQVILTPHFILDGKYHADREMVMEQLSQLEIACRDEKIDIQFHTGHELFIHRYLPRCLREKKCLSLAGSRYLLVEFPFNEYQEEYDFILEDLRAMGYIIIIAHPERYLYVQKDLNFCLRWLDYGDLLQCNQNSLFHKKTKKMIVKMMKHDFISFFASDAHGIKRPCQLSNAYQEVEQLCGKQKAEQLFYTNAEKIIKNECIENTDYEPVKKFLGLF